MIVKESGTEFTRKELYDLLTEMSVRKVAQEHQLDVANLTQCIEQHDIPRRTSGDWTRISMGRIVDREPLTGNPDELVFVARFQPKPQVEKKPIDEYEYPVLPPEPRSTDSSRPSHGHSKQGSVWASSRPKSWTPRPLNPGTNSAKKKGKSIYSSSVTINTGNLSRKRLEAFDQEKSLYEILDITPTDEYQKVTLFELQLSVRSINGLMREKLDTLHKVMSQSLAYLLEIRNLGSMSVESIMESCKKYCLRHPAEKEEKTEMPTGSPLTDPVESPMKTQTEMPAPVQAATPSSNNSLFVKLMMEFYKLNTTGQEVAVETIKAMTTIDRFKA